MLNLKTSNGASYLAWTTMENMLADVKSMEMIENLADLPFVEQVRIMPDFHLGKGAVIGSCVATTDCVIPMAVGADIGCGMTAVRTQLTVNDIYDGKFLDMRGQIKNDIMRKIPMGRNNNGKKGLDTGGHMPGNDAKHTAFNAYSTLLGNNPKFADLFSRNKECFTDRVNTYNHLGTLGTGNHFIEVCSDEEDRVWVFIHSGSRGIGGRVGNYYTRIAKQHMEKYHIKLADKELAYLPINSDDGKDYLTAMKFCQQFASTSRMIMASAVISVLTRACGTFETDLPIDCHHNFATFERHYGKNLLVTRKGAIHVPKGTLGLIPGSMGRKSYVVEGVGSVAAMDTASHGAGRCKSRTQAKRDHTVDDLRASMGDCVFNAEYADDLVDEIGDSYKPIDEVMELQKDLVKPVHTLKAMICLKGQG